MKRFLLLSLVVTFLLLLRRVLRAAAPVAASTDGPRRGRSTELVRDPVCDTFVPRTTALVVREGDRTYYFCSEECRSRHPAGSASHRAVELAS